VALGTGHHRGQGACSPDVVTGPNWALIGLVISAALWFGAAFAAKQVNNEHGGGWMPLVWGCLVFALLCCFFAWTSTLGSHAYC
jgi:hypothetical protein